RWFAVVGMCSLAVTACHGSQGARRSPASSWSSIQDPSLAGSSGARIPDWVPPDDGQWTLPAKDYASTRYSSLDEINTQNAKMLRVQFTFSTALATGHEAAPLVVGDTMYVVTPYPDLLYALDLSQPGVALRWT